MPGDAALVVLSSDVPPKLLNEIKKRLAERGARVEAYGTILRIEPFRPQFLPIIAGLAALVGAGIAAVILLPKAINQMFNLLIRYAPLVAALALVLVVVAVALRYG